MKNIYMERVCTTCHLELNGVLDEYQATFHEKEYLQEQKEREQTLKQWEKERYAFSHTGENIGFDYNKCILCNALPGERYEAFFTEV